MEQEVWRDAQKIDEKVGEELEVAMCTTWLDLLKQGQETSIVL